MQSSIWGRGQIESFATHANLGTQAMDPVQDRGAASHGQGAQGGVEGGGYGNSTNHSHREARANLAWDRIARAPPASLERRSAGQRLRGGGRTWWRKGVVMPPQDAPSAYRLRPCRCHPCLSHGLLLRQAPTAAGCGGKMRELMAAADWIAARVALTLGRCGGLQIYCC